jgi:2-polyprenyl-6-methoxyphenol hydroxylase-like FAD-dependent oxidoreductase
MKYVKTVLIVGAGPVGLTAACELLLRGVSCRIIDQAPVPSPFSKAFAIHARTLEVFEGLGISDTLLERGIQVPVMHFYQRAKRVVSIDFSNLNTRFPFVLSVPQSDTEAVLRNLLSVLGGEVEQGTTLTKLVQHAEGVEAVLHCADGSEETMFSEWLIGADGAHSTVRKELKIGWQGAAYDIDFLVADGKLVSGPEGQHGHTYITDAGYVMLFPLPGGAHRVVLDLSQKEQLDPVLQVGDVNRILAQRGLSHLEIREPFWLSTAHIRRMIAETYSNGRVFLAGDAAHIHSPVGGQGLNTGIQDAHNLAWKLAMVSKGRATVQFLASYEIERRPIAVKVLEATDALTRTLTDRNPLRRAIRTRLMPLAAKLSFVRRRLAEQAAGLSIDYRKSPAVAIRRSSHGGIRVGQHAPDCSLYNRRDGSSVQLSNEFRGGYYTLLLCIGHRQPNSILNDLESGIAELEEFKDLIKMRIITLAPQLDVASDQRHLVDSLGQAHTLYTGGGSGMCVVRPDGYVAFSSDLAGWQELRSFFNKQLSIGMNCSGATLSLSHKAS